MELAIKLHETLDAGDLKTFNTLLKTCSIETVLEFERIYQKTLLERCMEFRPPEGRFEAMKCLFASEFVDGNRKNSLGLTAVDVVVNTAQMFAKNVKAQATFNAIKRDMISAEIDTLSDEEAFYVMIKRGSLGGFKAFLAIKTDMEEGKRFEHICNAMITLSANCIPVDPKLKTYLQWMLSKYSYARLSGNGPTLDPSEWKTHIDVILTAWSHLEQQYDLSGFGSINDGVLRQLEIIHSRLYYLHFYYKNAFRHLPMNEIIFCLAVFLSFFKPPLIRFEPYKLIVNKRSITECLRETCKQLEAAKKVLQTIEEKLTVLVERYSRSEDAKDMEKDLISLEYALYRECVSTNPQMRKKWLKQYGSSDLPEAEPKYRFIHSRVNISNRIKAALKIANKLKDENKKSRPQKKNNVQEGKSGTENEDKRKNYLIDIVREIVSQESFVFNIFLTKKCRKIYKATRKDYAIAKQLHSISKILQYIDITTFYYSTVGSAIHAGALKKLIQVIGEAIKNTKETSNMPTKASNIVNTTLTNTFATICKSHREFFSHCPPMSKIIADEKEDVAIFELLQEHIIMVRAMFQMLLVVTIASVRQRFYGKAYQCRSIAELRMLFEHVGDMAVLDETQAKNIDQVERYFKILLSKLAKLQSSSAVRHTQEFLHVERTLKARDLVIKKLKEFVYSNREIRYRNMVVACRQIDANIATVRRMLTYNLLKKPNHLYEEIVDIWDSRRISLESIQWREVGLIALNPENVTHILKINERRMNNLAHAEYPKLIKSWLQDLEVDESNHGDVLKKLENSKSELHRYFHNVYEVQLKWSFLERYCGKKSAKLAELIKQDKKLLQTIFEDLLRKLKAILLRVGISSIEDLVEKSIEDIVIVTPSLEFYLLEVCELLKSVGYFGDNSYLLRKRVPILQGRNLRNSLAHDTLSYNILTDSDEMALFVNALAMVEHEHELFQSELPLIDVDIRSIAKLETVWIDQHRKMLKALKENNTLDAFRTLRSGYDLHLGLFTPERSPQKAGIFQTRVDVRELHDPLIALLDGYIEGFSTTITSPRFLSYVALGEADYATALTRSLEISEQTFIPDELYGWPNLIDGLRTKDVLSQFLSPAKGWDNLQQLVQSGNAHAVRQFITQVDISTLIKHPDTKYGVNPLSTGVIHGTENVCEVLADVCNLLQRTEAICYAIKIRWNEMFEKLIETAAVRNYDGLLNIALLSNNMVAADYLYGKIYPSSSTPSSSTQLSAMTKDTLDRSLKDYSRIELLKFCLAHNLVPVGKNSGPNWNNLLYCAIRNQNSPSVRYIIQQLKAHISFDTVMYPQQRKGMQTSLHLLVRDGSRKTLNKVCSINCQYYRDSDKTVHPIALAIQCGTDSRKVLAVLEKLGFDFLDCPSILQEAIKASNQHLMYRITDRLGQVTAEWDHLSRSGTHEALAMPMRVLQKWRTLGYLLQPVKGASTALHEAVEAVDFDFVKFLINACRKAQTVESTGQLDWITFQKTKTSEVHHFHLNDIAPYMKLRAYCEQMIEAITDKKVFETSFTTIANVKGVFYIPFEREMESMLSERVFRLTSALKSFTFDSVFPDCFNEDSDTLLLGVIVKTDSHIKCFLKANDSFCMVFGITEDDHAVPKLSAMVNFIDSRGSTPLHNCFPDETEKMLQLKKILKDAEKISGSKCTSKLTPSNTNEGTRKTIKNRSIVKEAKEILQLLCTEGANPLLLKNARCLAAIHFALQYCADRSIAFYLIDLCLKDDLRAQSGANVLEFDEGDGNTLLHHAIMCDRPDVVERLLELDAKVDTQNCTSLTPAMMVLKGALQNPSEMLKLLLDRDVGTLTTKDPYKKTLLHFSVTRPSTNILPVLLSSVLDFRAKVEQDLTLFAAKDNQNLTPFQAALMIEHIDWLKHVLNFANDNQVPNVIGSDEDLITIIAKREFDDIGEAAVKYFNDSAMSDEQFVIDFIARNTNNRTLVTYLKLVTVGH